MVKSDTLQTCQVSNAKIFSKTSAFLAKKWEFVIQSENSEILAFQWKISWIKQALSMKSFHLLMKDLLENRHWQKYFMQHYYSSRALHRWISVGFILCVDYGVHFFYIFLVPVHVLDGRKLTLQLTGERKADVIYEKSSVSMYAWWGSISRRADVSPPSSCTLVVSALWENEFHDVLLQPHLQLSCLGNLLEPIRASSSSPSLTCWGFFSKENP